MADAPRSWDSIGTCRDCGVQTKLLARYRCGACLMYRSRHGTIRPSFEHPVWARLEAAKRGEVVRV